MSKRVISILVSLLVLAISVTLLLVFMLGSNKKDNSDFKVPLNCIVRDLSLTVGEKISSFYQTNDETAEIYFEVDKTDIIDINKDSIKGLKAGKVNVTIKIVASKEEISKSFVVEVYEEGYLFEIIPLQYCNYVEQSKTLNVLNNIAIFEIKIYGLSGKKIEIDERNYIFDENKLKINYEFGNYIINQISQDSEITINFPKINFNIKLKIVCKF